MRITVDGFVTSPSFGGFISYVDAITRALGARDDLDVHFVVPVEQPFPPSEEFPAQVSVYQHPVAAREGVRDGVIWTDEVLPAALREIDPDVHFGPAFMLPEEHVRPQVVTVHDTMFERFPQFYGDTTRRYLREQTLRALRSADVAIAVSEATRVDALAEWEPDIPVRVTPLAPHYAPTSGSDRPQREPYLLNVGGAHRRKRVDVLVDAFASLVSARSDWPDLCLVLVGVAADRYVQDLVQGTRVRDRIVLTGRVSAAELSAWYEHAELFVYPSEYEGFGLGPLEAMASGVPVVTYRNSALAEVLGDAAVYVAAGPESLAEEMAALLGEPSRRAFLSSGGVAQAARFSWEETAAGTVAALQEEILRFHGDQGV